MHLLEDERSAWVRVFPRRQVVPLLVDAQMRRLARAQGRGHQRDGGGTRTRRNRHGGRRASQGDGRHDADGDRERSGGEERSGVEGGEAASRKFALASSFVLECFLLTKETLRRTGGEGAVQPTQRGAEGDGLECGRNCKNGDGVRRILRGLHDTPAKHTGNERSCMRNHTAWIRNEATCQDQRE